MAQLVEQLIRNQQVAGPNPASSSKKILQPFGWRIFYFTRTVIDLLILALRGPRKKTTYFCGEWA